MATNTPYLRAALAALVLLFAGARALAAEAAKAFDIAEGPALPALKQFAAQSGEQILYSADAVEGVTTQAVKGTFTPREALDRMIQGTKLIVVADKKNGALSLVRDRSPNGPRVAQEMAATPQKVGRTEDGVLILDKIEVEGRIDGVNNKGLLQAGQNAPLYHDIVTRTDIERMGVSSLEELFRYLPQTSSLSTALQAPAGNVNTTGGLTQSYSTVGLRGFSSAQTVLLVNGRTMPRTGLGNNGGADLSRIPLAAIERVEILPSSGSAIYGAGALGGAINIILRKEYTGRDLTTYIGTSTEGGATEYRLTYLEGLRFNEGRTSLTLTLSYHHRDALLLNERDYLNEALRRYGPDSTATNAQGQRYFEQYMIPAFAGAPGTIMIGSDASSPDLGIPGAPGARYAAIPKGTSPTESFLLTPESFAGTAGAAYLDSSRLGRTVIYEPVDALSFTAILEHEFIPKRLEGYAEFTLGRNKRDYSYPQSLSVPLTATDPLNPFRTGVTPGFVGRSVTLYLDTPDLPDSSAKHRYDSARLVAGLKGEINERWQWSVDGTLDYTKGLLDSDAPSANLTELNKISPYSSPGPAASAEERRAIYPIFADHSAYPVSSQIVAEYFKNVRHSFSDGVQKEANARLLGEVFSLPAGPLRASLVGKIQDWTYTSGQDYYLANGYSQMIHGVPAESSRTSSEASRTTTYGALELNVPVFSQEWNPVPFINGWEIQASISREKDSSKGVDSNGDPFVNDQSANSNVIATKIQITPDIAVRASFSEGFYPPNWSDVSLPESIMTLPGVFPDPARGNTMQFTPNMTVKQGGNPGLRPETAESYNLGLVFTPRFLPDFSLNVDFWRIEKTDAIVSQSFVNVIANPEAFGFLITREEPTAAEAAMGWLGRITEVDARAFNASITRTEGADIRMRYFLRTAEAGDFTFHANATFTNHFELLATPTSPVVDQIDGAGPVRWRGNAGVSWQRGRWSASVVARYVGERYGLTTDPSPSYPGAHPTDGHSIPAFVRTDLQLGYELPYTPGSKAWFQGTKWTLGVLNAANDRPAFLTDGTGFYDRADDPRQRFVYVQIKKSF